MGPGLIGNLDSSNTVDCFSLVLSRVQLFQDPVHASPPGSSVRAISQARIPAGLPFPSPGDLPDPGIQPTSPALAGGFFTTESAGKPRHSGYGFIIIS